MGSERDALMTKIGTGHPVPAGVEVITEIGVG